MQITITDKGIKPQDVFKIVSESYKYLSLDTYGYWRLFFDKPYMREKPRGNSIWTTRFGSKGSEIDIKIDYSGKAEDSLFCREDT